MDAHQTSTLKGETMKEEKCSICGEIINRISPVVNSDTSKRGYKRIEKGI